MTTWVRPVPQGEERGPSREDLVAEVQGLKDELAAAVGRLDAASDELKAAAAPLQARLEEIDGQAKP